MRARYLCSKKKNDDDEGQAKAFAAQPFVFFFISCKQYFPNSQLAIIHTYIIEQYTMSFLHRLSQLPKEILLLTSSHHSTALTSLSLLNSTSIIPTSLKGLVASFPCVDRISSWMPSSLAEMQLLAAPKRKVCTVLLQHHQRHLLRYIHRHRILSFNSYFTTPMQVTPHRKGNRSATKQIRFIPIVSKCSKCDRVFHPHSMPSKCNKDECPAFTLRSRPHHTFHVDEEGNNTEEAR